MTAGAGLCLFLRGSHLPNDRRTLQSGAQGWAGLALQEQLAVLGMAGFAPPSSCLDELKVSPPLAFVGSRGWA